MIIYYKSFYIFPEKIIKNFIMKGIVIKNLKKILKISAKQLRNH